jgi:hypothetical protein
MTPTPAKSLAERAPPPSLGHYGALRHYGDTNCLISPSSVGGGVIADRDAP